MNTKSPFLNYISEYMLTRQYSLRTVKTYLTWISGFIHFHNKRHPASMGDNEVEQYLDHLVLKDNVSPKTQATALNALVFMYKHIIKQELNCALNFVRSKWQPKLPVVMTPEEVKLLMSHWGRVDLCCVFLQQWVGYLGKEEAAKHSYSMWVSR
jgi:site-specific recombinase XerD